MKRLFCLLLFLPAVFALECSGLNPLDVGSAVINYYSSGDINIVFNSQNSVVEDLAANIRVVPQVNVSSASYTGALSKDDFNNTVLLFTQDVITTNTVSWNFRGTVSSGVVFPALSANPVFPYPYESLPSDVKQYVEFTEVADTNSAIRAKVNELVSGVTDYLTAVAIVSKFVSDYLEYDLNYAPSSVPATQVFIQKRGVCDEFSSLLISMLRNIGIPSRFVSGFAFTNSGSQSCTNFGPHSWIEIYVPGYGWMPTDPTYKEFFWVDAGHVPLYRSNDAGTKIINASILYVDASFSVESPDFDISFNSYSSPSSNLVLEPSLSFDEVGEGDYVLLNVSINNPTNKWVLDSLYLSTTSDMTVVYNNKSLPVILAPNTLTSYYFILLTPTGLSCPFSSCLYTFPVVVELGSGPHSLMNLTLNPNLIFGNYYDTYLSQISMSERLYSSDLMVFNKSLAPYKVVSEEPVLSFNIQNLGNTVLNDLTVSLSYGDVSYSENIGSLFISEDKFYSKKLRLPSSKGIIDVDCVVSSGNVSLPFELSFSVVSAPPFNFEILGESDYSSGSDYELSLSFSSIPSNYLNANIKILINGVEAVNKPFFFSSSTINLPKSLFLFGNNTITAVLEYNTIGGAEYLAQDSIVISSSLERNLLETIMEYINAVINVFKILLGIK